MQTKPRIHQRPNVLPLCLAAFFNDMGSDMLFAFYPLFLVIILGVGDMKVLGFLDSLALLVGLLLRPVSGRFADLQGRTRLIWAGYLCLAVSRLGQGLAQVWYHLAPAKVLYEVGRGVRNPPREALLAESVPQDERGLAFGLLKSMDTLGAVIGPLLGLGIFTLLLGRAVPLETSYRLVFFASALPTLVSIWLTLTRLQEIGVEAPRPAEALNPGGSPTSRGNVIAQDRRLLMFTALSCLFSLWAVTENFMLVSGARILGISREQIWPVVLLYWFINVTFAPTALVTGWLSDRYDRKPFVVVGLLILGALTAAFAWAGAFWQVGLLFALHGIYQGFLQPSQTALVADLAPEGRRAEALGSYAMWIGLFAIPGPFLFGVLWDAFTWQVPFVISGLFVGLSAVLLAALVPGDSR